VTLGIVLALGTVLACMIGYVFVELNRVARELSSYKADEARASRDLYVAMAKLEAKLLDDPTKLAAPSVPPPVSASTATTAATVVPSSWPGSPASTPSGQGHRP